MTATAGVVLAGGRSSRMGSPKAGLDWHGSTLLERTAGALQRAGVGRVVVVAAPGQALEPPDGVLLREDPVEGRGPLQGLAVGLSAASELGARSAFVCSVDLPFLHPVWVRRVLGALEAGDDVVLPVVRGFRQPLAAAYRTSLAPVCQALVADGRLRPAHLLDAVRTRVLDEAALLACAALAAADAGLDSVRGVNTPGELAAALARPLPLVRLLPAGRQVRAASVAGLGLPPGTRALLDGRPASPATPLVAGDAVTVLPP